MYTGIPELTLMRVTNPKDHSEKFFFVISKESSTVQRTPSERNLFEIIDFSPDLRFFMKSIRDRNDRNTFYTVSILWNGILE